MAARVEKLNWYQKTLLLVMLGMVLVFSVLYFITLRREGFLYQDTIFVPAQEGGNTVYTGKLAGKAASFTVTQDKTVTFRHGDTSYGPYFIKEDPSAIPSGVEVSGQTAGVEVWEGEEVIFRGAATKVGDAYWLQNEDGTTNALQFFYIVSDGTQRDIEGNIVDRVRPTADTILELLNEPALSHKGEFPMWLLAVALSLLNAGIILYADELFRWNLSFQIRNAQDAEPSEREIAGRYIGWTMIVIASLAVFIIGLRM